MSKDLDHEEYCISSGGRIPVKWTVPEVGLLKWLICAHSCTIWFLLHTKIYRLCFTRSTVQAVMSGALEW